MADDEDPRPIEVQRSDLLEFGGSGAGGQSRRGWIPWLPLGLVAALATFLVVDGTHTKSPSAPPTSAPATAQRTVAPSEPAAVEPTASGPATTGAGHPLLGITGSWNLFARSGSEVIRIEFARGRVTTTSMPPLRSGGPVSFVVGDGWAMVRPLDFVPGYIVADGRAAGDLSGALGRGGEVLPGPDGSHVWLLDFHGTTTKARLVDVDGRSTNTSITIPADMTDARPDGTGYLVINATGGVYTARPDGLRRVTTGTLMAVGPTRWLVTECDTQHRCQPVVIDRVSGARHVVTGIKPTLSGPTGVISPDGSTAALHETDDAGVESLHLVDLGSGRDRRVKALAQAGADPDKIAWSPDSAWLFIAGASGTLDPIDAASATMTDLGVRLPTIDQLDVRP